METLIRNLIRRQPDNNIPAKFRELFYGLLIHLSSTFISAILILSIDYLVVHILGENSIYNSHFNKDDYIQKFGLIKSIFFITIKGPICEELAFRLVLIPKSRNIFLGIFSLMYLLLEILTPLNYSEIFVILSIVFIIYILYCEKLSKYLLNFVLSLQKERLLVVSSLCFGIIHIVNFKPINLTLIYLYPIYILPQICLGFVLGTLRLRNGFIWAVILHILINSSVNWYNIFSSR